jgi:hypothetical protein
MAQDNSPPAFPTIQHELVAGFATETSHPGMSLRDWFAGQALVGLLADGKFLPESDDEIGTGAYEIADAMLRARDQH